METVFVNATQDKEIATLQNCVLRQLMSLPTRTATPSLYILSGTLPIRAIIDSRKLILIGNICSGVNSSLQYLFIYQCATRSPESQSWFVQAAQLLAYYDLPSVSDLIENPPGKAEWKLVVKKAVRNYWTTRILKEATEKSSLQYLNTAITAVWSTPSALENWLQPKGCKQGCCEGSNGNRSIQNIQ